MNELFGPCATKYVQDHLLFLNIIKNWFCIHIYKTIFNITNFCFYKYLGSLINIFFISLNLLYKEISDSKRNLAHLVGTKIGPRRRSSFYCLLIIPICPAYNPDLEYILLDEFNGSTMTFLSSKVHTSNWIFRIGDYSVSIFLCRKSPL